MYWYVCKVNYSTSFYTKQMFLALFIPKIFRNNGYLVHLRLQKKPIIWIFFWTPCKKKYFLVLSRHRALPWTSFSPQILLILASVPLRIGPKKWHFFWPICILIIFDHICNPPSSDIITKKVIFVNFCWTTVTFIKTLKWNLYSYGAVFILWKMLCCIWEEDPNRTVYPCLPSSSSSISLYRGCSFLLSYYFNQLYTLIESKITRRTTETKKKK